MNPPALRHPNYQIPFFLIVYVKEGNALGLLAAKHGDHPSTHRVLQSTTGPCGMGIPPLPQSRYSTAFLVNSTGEIVVGSPFTMSVPRVVKILLNSHHIQRFSVSCLTSYKVRLFTATLLSSVANEVPHDCLMLMGHLLTPRDDLQESFLSNADFSWFMNGSSLKSDHCTYWAGYAIATPFDVVKAASLPVATLAQKADLYAFFTQACTLAKDKLSMFILIVDILSEQLMILECCGSNVPSLRPAEIKLKMTPMFRNDQMPSFTCCLAIEIPGLFKLGSLKAKGNHLADISIRCAALKGTNRSQTSVMV